MSRGAACQVGVLGVIIIIWALAATDLPGPVLLLTAAAGAPLVALTLWGHSRAGTVLALVLLMLAAQAALNGEVATSLIISVLLLVLLLLAGQLAADTYTVEPTAVLAVCATSAMAMAGIAVSQVAFYTSFLWWPTAIGAMLVAYALALPVAHHPAPPRDDGRTEV